MSESFHDSQDGFEIIGLRNEHLQLKVAPALGGKIVSVMDRRSDREWMWHPGKHLELFTNRMGDSFAQSTMCGADECLPTVAACRVNGNEVPDHGEVWNVPWELGLSQLEEEKILLRVSLPVSPFDFSRTISLDGSVARFEYRLHNRSDRPKHYLWAFHPLMRIEEGDRIELEAKYVRVETTSWPADQRGDYWNWPSPREGTDLARLDLGATPAYAKCFVPAGDKGRIVIRNPQRGEQIAVEYDSPHIAALGIWLSRGGWNGYHHVAIEPTNAAADSLADVMKENLYQPLAAGESVKWSFRIIVGA